MKSLQAPVLQDNNGFICVTRTTRDLLFPLPVSHLPMAPALPGYCTGTSNSSYSPAPPLPPVGKPALT